MVIAKKGVIFILASSMNRKKLPICERKEAKLGLQSYSTTEHISSAPLFATLSSYVYNTES